MALHGFHIFRDGNAWCAVGPHFHDLAVSDAGFGPTKSDAIKELGSKIDVPLSTEFTEVVICRQCREFVEADCEPDGCRDPGCPLL